MIAAQEAVYDGIGDTSNPHSYKKVKESKFDFSLLLPGPTTGTELLILISLYLVRLLLSYLRETLETGINFSVPGSIRILAFFF